MVLAMHACGSGYNGKQRDTEPGNPCEAKEMSNEHDVTPSSTFRKKEAMQQVAMKTDKDEAKNLEVIVALNQSLAHAIDLRSRMKQAYWSAKGGNFYMLHKKFNDFSNDLDAVADEFAARVLALGGVPVRTISIVARTSKLPPYPLGSSESFGASGCGHRQIRGGIKVSPDGNAAGRSI